jgi:glucose-1-phosphate cytidylyltransferase
VKAVILAGGMGTRISEETISKPKPLIEIGGMPILWHIMKIYSSYGVNDFVICCGYKGYMIKNFFSNYSLYTSDVTFNLKNNTTIIHNNTSEPWAVTLVDTGEKTMTGGRLKRVQNFLDDETFCFTYGDGLSNINITNLIKFHKTKKKLATLTAVLPPGKYGNLGLKNDDVISFQEKPEGDGGWINGGFFVLEPKVFDYLIDDSSIWEKEPLENLTKDYQLSAFKHEKFWHPMDTLRDKMLLEKLWNSEKPPWKTW